MTSRLHSWPLLDADKIRESTPTQKDGWTASQEVFLRRKAARVIYETAKNFVYQMSSGTAAVAVTLFIRFYSKMSMVKYHPFVMSLASLFVAGKVNDEPRSLQSLMIEMLKQWYDRANPELRERLGEPEKLKKLWNTTVDAEHILLITLGFDLNIDLVIPTVAQLAKKLEVLEPMRSKEIQQKYLSLCNDMMKNDSMLVLQYSSKTIALAICYLIFKRSKLVTRPPDTSDGKHWYEEYGLVEKDCEDICTRLTNMYKKGARSTSSGKRSLAESSKTNLTEMMSTAQRPSSPQSRVGSPTKKSRTMDESNAHAQQSQFTELQAPFTQMTEPQPQGAESDDSVEEGEIR